MKSVICFVFTIIYCTEGILFKTSETNRIISGNEATELQFPYMISLQQRSASQLETRGHRCGGTLITLQHVLTTASCLYNNVNGFLTLINPADYRVFAGSSRLTNDVTLERVRSIANITVHPEFIGTSQYAYDIAVITLAEPFNTSIATPLELPLNTYTPTDFTLCTTSGWGATNISMTTSPIQTYANKFIYNHGACMNLYEPSLGSLSSDILYSMVCAASYDRLIASCINDNGNPLVCEDKLTGILIANAGCTLTSYPEIYTQVSNYTTWVYSVTGSAHTLTPGIMTLILFSFFQISLYI